jgi:hypothetical protein
MLLSPLMAAACGGIFTADANTEQSAERMIYAVGPGQVTLYEQITYTGSPQNFAWVLPVPAVPQVSLVSTDLFRDLDNQTAPDIYTQPSPSCFGNLAASAPVGSAEGVTVDDSGTVGPYDYDVINSTNAKALTDWLTSNSYKIPAASASEIQIYTGQHMYFLAMRLRGAAGVNNMTPVKISYPSTQQQITIPLRMATPMSQQRLNVTLWIFGQSRFLPQNYTSVQLSDSQLSTDADPMGDYSTLVGQAVDAAGGRGFVTDYAQPTSQISAPASDTDLQGLVSSYPYLTRLYTSLAPAQITQDPTFAAATGQANVSAVRVLPASSAVTFCGYTVQQVLTVLGVIMVVFLLAIFIVRRKIKRAS